MSGESVTDKGSGIKAVNVLQSKGPGCIVLTMGSAGVLFTQPGNDAVTHIEAEKVNVVDTTVSKITCMSLMCKLNNVKFI